MDLLAYFYGARKEGGRRTGGSLHRAVTREIDSPDRHLVGEDPSVPPSDHLLTTPLRPVVD